MVKTEKYIENKMLEKVTSPVFGTVHVKAPAFDGSTHWTTYLRQFEASASTNNWTEKDLSLIHI